MAQEHNNLDFLASLKLDEATPTGYQAADNDTTTRLRTRHQS